MGSRGGDHPFILYSYAIHDASIGGSDYEVYLKRAKTAEERFRARGKQYIFEMANAYIRNVAISKQTPESWHNYALCR
jgi:hypothetical protein